MRMMCAGPMKPDLPILPFAIALFIGALIGLDRERRKVEAGSTGVGGIRTFILFAMSGAISAWLAVKLSTPWIFLTAAICVTIIVMTGHAVYSMRNEEAARGLTTEIAAFVTFLLGGLALFGQQTLAVALGIAASAILSYKKPIHGAIGRLGEDDVHAMLKLLMATFIVLPVLPNHPVDPWGALNPYKMWWIVILISAMSLIGYIASRRLGERRALPLIGLFGGIASSTVVSLEFSKRSREAVQPGAVADALTSGLLFSWWVMFLRIILIVAAINAALVWRLVPPMAAMGCVTLALALIFYRRASRHAFAAAASGETADAMPLKNPFSLTAAIKFAALFAVILLVVKIVPQFFKSQGMYLVAALAGLTDVDAISVSMAGYGNVPQQASVAALSIVIAAVTNTFVKLGFVIALGRGGIKPRMILATILILVAGAATILA